MFLKNIILERKRDTKIICGIIKLPVVLKCHIRKLECTIQKCLISKLFCAIESAYYSTPYHVMKFDPLMYRCHVKFHGDR